MAVTPQFELPLPADGQTPWGADYRAALTEIDARLLSVRGSFFVENNATATVAPSAAGAKAVLTGVQSGPACRFCAIDGNRITYTGVLSKVPTVIASVNVETAAQNTVEIQVRVNGVRIAGANKKARLGPAVTTGFVSVAANLPLDTGDFVELWVANLTGSENVTVTDATLVMRG